MRQHHRQLDEQNIKVCVVTFDSGPLAKAYVRDTQLTWPLLVDHERTLYHAYGMHRGTWWNLYGPPAIGVYLKLLWRGRHLQRPGSDVQQLGGDVLIDPEGVVKIQYAGVGPADRPEISTLLEPTY